MKAFTYKINDPIGIHARPAGLIVKCAAEFESDIVIECNGKKADAKRIFAIMGLGVKGGDEVTVTADGSDEEKAAETLLTLFAAEL